MKSFEDSPHTYIADSQTELSTASLSEFKNLEKLKLELLHEQEYLEIQSEDLDRKIKKFFAQKENFEQSYRKKQESLRKKEFELSKREAEFYKIYENFSNEKEKWRTMIDTQLEEIENRELELEVQREELASELEKCQLLGESLHKIQSDIRNKSIMVNEREKNIKVCEENWFIKCEDFTATELKLKEKEKELWKKEQEICEIFKVVEIKAKDIEKTSEMFEKINKNLLEKELKVQKETEFLLKTQAQLEKQKLIYEQNFKKMEKWESELDTKGRKIQNFEENIYQKIKTIESIEFKTVVPSVTTEEDDDCSVIGFNVLTPRSNESYLSQCV